MITPVIPTDSTALTELTIRSKDHWNYGADLIEQWRDDLTLTENYLEKNRGYKLIKEDKIIGYYVFEKNDNKTVKLEWLFVEPTYIGKGYGRQLVSHFLEICIATGIKKILLDADPNAEQFYAHFGFRTIDKKPTSIPNRFMPVMELTIPD